MPFVAAPNVIEVEFLYTLFGSLCENRIMVDHLAAVDEAACEAAAILGWNWWETEYAANITSGCLLRGVQATDLSAADGAQFIYAPDTTTFGTGSGSAMPNEVSLCVSLRTASRGRSARGRWYVAGIPNTQMANANNIESSYGTSLITDMQSLINQYVTAGEQPVIVSYISGGDPRPGGPVYYPIESATIVDTVVDSQRRRKPGVGS